MSALVVQRLIAANHPAFDGHFPGRPVLPGVVLLAEVYQAIESVPGMVEAVGNQPVLVAAKFLAPVSGGCVLDIGLQLGDGVLAFEVSVDATTVAKGQYQARREPGSTP